MRPRKQRRVLKEPDFNLFKPAGIRAKELQTVTMLIEEYEAIRLADYENLKQEEAAKLMEISRPTFTRLIESARKKLAVMIIEGKALSIEGGSFRYQRGKGRRFKGHHLFEDL